MGSMKSGTTYLHALLNSHPFVFMCEPKEPCYFVEEKQLRVLHPRAWRQGYWKHEDCYLKLFEPADGASVIGEASIFYAFLPMASGVPERIKRFNPDARLIYLMRDPVERSVSHYWHNVRHFGEYRLPLEAITRDKQYVDVSYYAMQLQEYFRWFSQDQIMVLTFEELTEQTDKVIGSIFNWLRLDNSCTWRTVGPQNVGPDTVRRPIWKWQRLRRRNSLVRAAVDHVPTSVRQHAARLFTRQVEVGSVDLSAVAAHLRPLQHRQTQELTKLLGRQFPEWTTLGP
jgi:hypothetical protein